MLDSSLGKAIPGQMASITLVHYSIPLIHYDNIQRVKLEFVAERNQSWTLETAIRTSPFDSDSKLRPRVHGDF